MQRSRRRLEALTRRIKADRVEAILIHNQTSVTYLTGYTGDDSILLVAPARSIIVSAGLDENRLREECGDFEVRLKRPDEAPIAAIADVVNKLGIKRLAIEGSTRSEEAIEALGAGLKTVEIVALHGHVEQLRMIKDRSEKEAIRGAIESAERAFAMTLAGLRGELSEVEVANRLDGYMRYCGASGPSFPPIVAVGKRSAKPHAKASEASRIGDAAFTLIDWGATRFLYQSDLTRMVVTGKVTTKFERVYETVAEAHRTGVAAIRPGIPAKEVDAKARAVIESAGYGRYFEHGLGHGLGLEIHEAPRLRRDCDIVLEPGMVVTVEPGIYLPRWGGVRLEDDVLVTPDGREVLSRAPRSLDECRVPGSF
jgi:Xaa-Pro aminopeptidase